MVSSHAPSGLKVQALHDGCRLESAGRTLEVNTAAHSLVVAGRRRRLEFAATREGLRAATIRIVRALRVSQPLPSVKSTGRSPLRPAETTSAQRELFAATAPREFSREEVSERQRADEVVSTILLDALRRSAERRWRVPTPLEEVVAMVDALDPTPLVYSTALVERRYLAGDVVRHRAAAIAVSQLERTIGLWERPEHLPALCAPLEDWASLYSPTRTPTRALHKTLALYGDTAAPRDLWMLRALHLTRPVQSALHLEVLAERVRVTRACGVEETLAKRLLAEQCRLIEQAPPAELEEQLLRVAMALHQRRAPRQWMIHYFCELLSEQRRAVEASHLRQLVGRLLETGARRRNAPVPRGETARPPIALPTDPGITFLASTDAVYDEGRRMNHCIGTRARAAVEGEAYLFHVTFRGAQASAQIARDGEVVEVSGPCNDANIACTSARRALESWALPLRPLQLGEAGRSIWREPGPTSSSGTPLRTLADCVAALERARHWSEIPLQRTVDWLLEAIPSASAGNSWIVEQAEGFVVLEEDGRVRRAWNAATARVGEDGDDDDATGRGAATL